MPNSPLESLFPMPPYAPQLKIASQIHKTLVQGDKKVLIVQSPTGTGKTYALLVGVLGWMMEHPEQISYQQKNNHTAKEDQSDNEGSMPSWIVGKAKQIKLQKLVAQKKQRFAKVKSIKQAKELKNKKYPKIKQPQHKTFDWQALDVQDLDSNSHQNKKRKPGQHQFQMTQPLIPSTSLPKLIFVSRTHSQLSQALSSLSSLPVSPHPLNLASKDHLCIHPQLSKNKVHQKCQYLMAHGGCPYYHQESVEEFFGVGVEEARKIGQGASLCAYFGVKNLVPLADVLFVPYASVLMPEIRQRLGIVLDNAIVVFDEAHNVIEQELSMNSPEIKFKQLSLLCQKIDSYKQKYGARSKKQNLDLITHMQEICRRIMDVLTSQFQKYSQSKDSINYNDCGYVTMTKIELFSKMKLPELKVHEIKTYIALSNFDQKLANFSEQSLKKTKSENFSIQIITRFLDFVTSIITPQSDQISKSTLILCKNLSQQSVSETSIKIYQMQAQQLSNIINQSRLTIFAGGTMQPLTQFTELFNRHKITYSQIKGQHVIKPQQCKVFTISGTLTCPPPPPGPPPQKTKLSFTFTSMRTHKQTLMPCVVKLVAKIVQGVQGGTVIFIQNYGMLATMMEYLGDSVAGAKVFYDQQASQGESVFDSYSHVIKKDKKKALLVSVMGGRLSEGINFSDQLARAIIVLGLPYPNIKSPQLIEKMKFISQKPSQKTPVFQSANKKLKQQEEETGQMYYENCCMKVVNQTIGRGIRHKDDFADIYLVDDRFQGVTHKLAQWMQERVSYIEYFPC